MDGLASRVRQHRHQPDHSGDGGAQHAGFQPHEQHEPHQADLRVVVHANAGQVGDGVDEPALARGLGLAFQAGALFLSLGEEPLLFDGLVTGVYAIDFGVPKVIVVNIGVAGDRDRSCR